MGKYDYISELTGTENYLQWRRQMILALKGERLWNHCSSGTDSTDLAELASSQPVPVDPTAITNDEREKILDWLAKDAQAKALIDRTISTVLASQLSDSQTAREQWETLSLRHARDDLTQYELRLRIRSEKLKDADDATRYLGVFEDVRRRFIQIGATYSDDEAIFDLLQGLPDVIEWRVFKEFAINRISTTAPSSSTPTPLTFEDVVKLFTVKANAIIRKRKLAGPGSEYSNTATPPYTPKINPVTGLRIYKNNPKGIKCTNPLCAELPRAENHDHAHCYWPGGGMESNAPAWMNNKNPNNETAVVAASPSTPPPPRYPSPQSASAEPRRELSCATIIKISDDGCNCIQANGTYSLTNVEGGTCLDLSGGDNMSIIGHEYHNGPNQAWVFESAGGDKTFYLKSAGSGQYLSAAGEPHDGQKVVVSGWPYTWRVEGVHGVDKGVRLLPANSPKYCVDLSGYGNSTPGTPVQLWGRWKGQNQVWKLQKIQ